MMDVSSIAGNRDDNAPAVVSAAVGVDAQSKVCQRIGTIFRDLVGEIHPDLAEVLGPREIQPEAVAAWLSEQATSEAHRERHPRIKNAGFFPLLCTSTDELQDIQCVLVLDSGWLIDPGKRRRLAAELARGGGRVSCFLILMVDERESNEINPNSQELAEWLKDFAPLGSRRICLYWISPIFNNGDPIEYEDLAESTAIALCTDLILAHRLAERVLTDHHRAPLATLATFGVRGLRYDPEIVANALSDALAQGLVYRTMLNRSTGPAVQTQYPTGAQEIISAIFKANPTVQARPVTSTTNSGLPGRNCPFLRGKDFSASVDLGQLAEQVRLESNPRAEWKERLYEWDFLLRHSRVPRYINRIKGQFDVILKQDSRILLEKLGDVFPSDGGASHYPEWIDAFEARVAEQYSPQLSENSTPNLEGSLKRLDRALARIPHGPSLVLRVAALLGAQGWLGWLFWQAQDSFVRTILLCADAALIVLTIGLPILWRLHALSRAEAEMRRILGEIENRCQLDFCRMMRDGFERIRGVLTAELERHRKILKASADSLRNRFPADTQFQPEMPGGGLVQRVPNGRQVREMRELLVKSELRPDMESEILGRFRDLMEEKILEILRESVPVEKLTGTILEFARQEIRKRLLRFKLWNFMCKGLNEPAGEPLDPEMAEEMLSVLKLDTSARVFLRSPVVTDAILEQKIRMAFIGDSLLRHYNPLSSHSDFIDTGCENVAASMMRVELASAPMQGAPEETAPVNEPRAGEAEAESDEDELEPQAGDDVSNSGETEPKSEDAATSPGGNEPNPGEDGVNAEDAGGAQRVSDS